MKNLALSAVEARTRVEIKEGTYKVASTTLTLTTDDRVELKTITQEIAEIVGAPVGTIKSRLHHAFVGLRRALDPLGGSL